MSALSTVKKLLGWSYPEEIRRARDLVQNSDDRIKEATCDRASNRKLAEASDNLRRVAVAATERLHQLEQRNRP